jgi:hypothetical protein
VTLYDAQKNILENHYFNTTETVFKKSFQLPNEDANYLIGVTVNNQKEWAILREIKVKEVSDVQFRIIAPSIISINDRYVAVKISTKYSFKELLNGSGQIHAELRSLQDVVVKSKNFKIKSDKLEVLIDFVKDFDLEFLARDIHLVLNASFTEKGTLRTISTDKIILVKQSPRNVLSITKSSNDFVMGMPFYIHVNVKTVNEDEIETRQGYPVTMKLEYKLFDGITSETKTKLEQVENGIAKFELNPPENAKEMVVKFTYNNVEHEEKFSYADTSEVIQVNFPEKTFPTTNVQIGDNLELNVHSRIFMEELTLLVVTPNGVVFQENYPDAKNNKEFELSLSVTKEMGPEATVFIFYLEMNKKRIIYDKFDLIITSPDGENYVSV